MAQGRKGTVPNLIGRVFGRLTVVRFAGYKHHNSLWECRCVCGTIRIVNKAHLGKDVNSCGCLKREMSGAKFRTHGCTNSIEYQTWTWMKSRCLNPNNKRYADWGGRGIKVCERWINSFENFLEDMGLRPKGHSIDRINNDGDYEPSNCRWAKTEQQMTNRRNSLLITYEGMTLTATEWSRRTGIQRATIEYRCHAGWTDAEIITTPVRKSSLTR